MCIVKEFERASQQSILFQMKQPFKSHKLNAHKTLLADQLELCMRKEVYSALKSFFPVTLLNKSMKTSACFCSHFLMFRKQQPLGGLASQWGKTQLEKSPKKCLCKCKKINTLSFLKTKDSLILRSANIIQAS